MVSLPLTVTVIILLAISNTGNVFFVQPRPGYREKIFLLYKFKTMNDKKDKYGQLLADEHRLTKIGKFIRNSSLDEIPQMINVLTGDMSLIGPRPLLVKYLRLYDEEQRKRHLVKPGITGWAQVNGRNAISWNEKFKLDVWYVNNQSFLLDLRIFFKTIQNVFLFKGISEGGAATMSEFRGNLN